MTFSAINFILWFRLTDWICWSTDSTVAFTDLNSRFVDLLVFAFICVAFFSDYKTIYIDFCFSNSLRKAHRSPVNRMCSPADFFLYVAFSKQNKWPHATDVCTVYIKKSPAGNWSSPMECNEYKGIAILYAHRTSDIAYGQNSRMNL